MDIYGDMNPADLNDTLVGTADADSIFGGQGDDSLSGGDGVDTLYGGVGNDTLDAGPAGVADSLVGGAGDDTYIVHDAAAKIVENPGEGVDTVVTDTGYGDLNNYPNVENLSLDDHGGGYFYGYGGADANLVQEIGTADYLVLSGNGGDDTIVGVATAYGQYDGGDGNDSLVATGSGQAYLSGDAGNDTLDASAVAGTATLYGGDGGDVLVGGSGADILQGGAGADTMTGGAGVDTFLVEAPDAAGSVDEITDFQVLPAGTTGVRDVLDLSQIVQSFTNYISGDNPFTEASPHLQFVTEGADTVLQVRLDGTGAWSDLIKLDGVDLHDLTPDNFSPGYDPTGATVTNIYDTLTGGTGADVFRFDAPVSGDDDVVTDFTSGTDFVALSKAGFGIASLADFDIVTAAGGPTEAKATLIVDTVNHTISWDADGTGAGTAVLLAHGDFTTNAADYLVF